MTKRVWITLLVIALAVALAVMFRAHSHKILLQGEVDAPEVIVTSKAKGRLITRHVERGDDVEAGQVLMTLDSPELLAQLSALEADRDKAQAFLDASLHGTREETVRSLQAQLSQAQAAYQEANNDFNRVQSVAAKGFISQSALDNARRARDTAYQQVRANQAALDAGLKGDRDEQRAAYEADLRHAEQAIIQFKQQTDDLLITAPVAGEVGSIPAEVGVLLNAGSPLLTLTRLADAYFVFNLREDILVNVRKGNTIQIRVPALGEQMIAAEVRFIAPMGDYATKRATRATGDFDLKTFEVRLYPLQPVDGLRPGMSALWQWDE